MLAGLLLASGLPIVRKPDRCAGGLHEAESSGGPCRRLGAVHSL